MYDLFRPSKNVSKDWNIGNEHNLLKLKLRHPAHDFPSQKDFVAPRPCAMPPRLPLSPATPIINRRLLSARNSNGHQSFLPQIRKLVFEYCDVWPSSTNLRKYIYNHVEALARENPHVEFVVKQRTSKEPIIRGFYRALPPHSLCFLN